VYLTCHIEILKKGHKQKLVVAGSRKHNHGINVAIEGHSLTCKDNFGIKDEDHILDITHVP
jgi:hypothetical protein